MSYSLLLLGYEPVQHVTVLNTVGNCNTMVLLYYIILYYIILYYIILYYIIIIESPSYMRSVVDRNVVRRRIPVRPIYIINSNDVLVNLATTSLLL